MKRVEQKESKVKAIEVVHIETGNVVHRVDCRNRSQSAVDKVEKGMLINMDRDRFFTRQVEVTELPPVCLSCGTTLESETAPCKCG